MQQEVLRFAESRIQRVKQIVHASVIGRLEPEKKVIKTLNTERKDNMNIDSEQFNEQVELRKEHPRLTDDLC